MTPGIHLLHKPPGPTSFSIVSQLMKTHTSPPGRRLPRICHGGTLDPFASGLLLILVEPATRLFDYLHDIPKTYDATVRWGIETDNGDPLGSPVSSTVSTADPSNLNADLLDQTLQSFIGWHDQTPHPTSAKRIAGERAYLKAHRGETVVMPPCRVYLHEAQWLSHDLPTASRLRMTVRGGYYVRALARDLGRSVGCGAHLQTLHRQSIGPWQDPGESNITEIHNRDLLPWLPSRALTDMEVGDLRLKKPIPLGELQPPDWPLPAGFPRPQPIVRGFHLDRFSALLKSHETTLTPITEYRGGL
jgi:tRNA pseudouridine55 synthase